MAEVELDELERLIGRIVRADVQLEFVLRLLFSDLASGPARELVPGDLTGLNKACKAMMRSKAMILNPQQKRDANDVFDAVTKAHAKRNRATHDLLFPRTDLSTGWRGVEFRPGSVFAAREHNVDLDVLTETLSDLRSAAIRVQFLKEAITDGPRMSIGVEDWAIARGEFDLEGGGFRPHVWNE